MRGSGAGSCVRPIESALRPGTCTAGRRGRRGCHRSHAPTPATRAGRRAHVRQLFGETIERIYIGQHHEDTAVLTHLRGDVVEALMTITGEPHPLARSRRPQGSPNR